MSRPRRGALVSYTIATLFSMTLGYLLLQVPIQVTDCFTNLLALDQPFGTLIRDVSFQPGYLRPALWMELKVVYDLSGGDYFTWFRWTQVLQGAATMFFFVALLRPQTRTDALVVPLGLAALIGHHTFAWTMREAFPINTFLTIVLACAAAANLAAGTPRRWTDAAAVALFVVSAATVESGLIIGGIFIVGYGVGCRGVSRRAVAVVVLLIVAYFGLRFGVMSVGVPTLADRDAGFGLARRDASEIARMFGNSASMFYLYNVVSSVAGLLFAEPRDGVWSLTGSLLRGRLDLPLLIGLVSSTLGSGFIARYCWVRRRAWREPAATHGDRVVLVALAVGLGNAAISFAYTKDVIMSPAGFFWAAALVVAVRHFVDGLTGERWSRLSAVGRASALSVLCLLSTTWALRAVGLHAALTQTAYEVREQWAYADRTLMPPGSAPMPPKAAALKTRLQQEAIFDRPGKPPLRDEWTRLFEIEQ